MYLIAVKGPFAWKRRADRILYRTKAEAEAELTMLRLTRLGEFKVFDADHEPGRSLANGKQGEL